MVAVAEELVERLGQMKGAAMKIGQVISTVEPFELPDEERDRIQRKLGELRNNVEPVGFPKIRKVIEQDLDGPRQGALRGPRGGRVRGRLHRPGAPRDHSRRRAGGGEGPVPRHRRGRRGRPAQPQPHLPAGATPGARPRHEGARQRDPRAHLRGARLRARGAEPPHDGAHLARPSLHLRAAGDQLAVRAARAGVGVRGGHALRRRARARPGRTRSLRRDRLPLLLRHARPRRPRAGRPAPGQLPAAPRRQRVLPRLRAGAEGLGLRTSTGSAALHARSGTATPRACTAR